MEQQVLSLLKDRVEGGMSKTALEKAIGLPKNSLSNVLKGRTKLSKNSILKCEVYFGLNVVVNDGENVGENEAQDN